MRYIIPSLFGVLILYTTLFAEKPVFNNPGIPPEESFNITDYIDDKTGFVTAKINILQKESNNAKYYNITVNEGDIFFNEIELNCSDLTTISEKRTDLRTKSVLEYFTRIGNDTIYFHNKEKRIDKKYSNNNKNIYSRYAYFFSFRGFPFDTKKAVEFKSYFSEYGDALTMKVTNLGKTTVTVKAGTFGCYKLELCVSGWQSIFAGDKYYLYFNVENPHQFIKYEENDNGHWNANELIKINK